MNAAFDLKKHSLTISVAESSFLIAKAAKEKLSLTNYIRQCCGLPHLLIGRPTRYERAVREDAAVEQLRFAGVTDILSFFPPEGLASGRPKPKAKTRRNIDQMRYEAMMEHTQAIMVWITECASADAKGQERPPKPQLNLPE